MAKRSAAEIFAAARAAGLSLAAATIATAIGLAESGGDDRVYGDTGIQTAVWGPSVGIWQIRTLKAQTNTGSDRDINALLNGGVARQAAAMRNISAGGNNWTPWSVYTSGAYRSQLGAAQSAAAGGGQSLPGSSPVVDPAGLAAGLLDIDGLVDGFRDTGLKLAGVVLGLVLVGAGVTIAVVPAIRKQAVKAVTG